MNYFLYEALPKAFKNHPQIYLDTSLKKHFIVRDADGRGFFGFYPQGRLICTDVKEFVRRYGEMVAEVANGFRKKIMSIKLVSNKKQADMTADAINEFISELNQLKS